MPQTGLRNSRQPVWECQTDARNRMCEASSQRFWPMCSGLVGYGMLAKLGITFPPAVTAFHSFFTTRDALDQTCHIGFADYLIPLKSSCVVLPAGVS